MIVINIRCSGYHDASTSDDSKVATAPAGILWNGKDYYMTPHPPSLPQSWTMSQPFPPVPPFMPPPSTFAASEARLVTIPTKVSGHSSSLTIQLWYDRGTQSLWLHCGNEKVNGLTFPRVIFSLHSKAWHWRM